MKKILHINLHMHTFFFFLKKIENLLHILIVQLIIEMEFHLECIIS